MPLAWSILKSGRSRSILVRQTTSSISLIALKQDEAGKDVLYFLTSLNSRDVCLHCPFRMEHAGRVLIDRMPAIQKMAHQRVAATLQQSRGTRISPARCESCRYVSAVEHFSAICLLGTWRFASATAQCSGLPRLSELQPSSTRIARLSDLPSELHFHLITSREVFRRPHCQKS